MKRILIQNGTIYDGLGGQPYQADLLVQDDRIVQIAPGITEQADQVIDATGKVVTPGFVDIHRHHDAKPLNDPHFGEVELAQGITTAVAGNCGISMTPRPEKDADAQAYYSFEEAVMGPHRSGRPPHLSPVSGGSGQDTAAHECFGHDRHRNRQGLF